MKTCTIKSYTIKSYRIRHVKQVLRVKYAKDITHLEHCVKNNF